MSDDNGLVHCETALVAGKRRFSYAKVDNIFISPSNQLTIQIGNEVFSVRFNPRKAQHQQFIDELCKRVKATC